MVGSFNDLFDVKLAVDPQDPLIARIGDVHISVFCHEDILRSRQCPFFRAADLADKDRLCRCQLQLKDAVVTAVADVKHITADKNAGSRLQLTFHIIGGIQLIAHLIRIRCRQRIAHQIIVVGVALILTQRMGTHGEKAHHDDRSQQQNRYTLNVFHHVITYSFRPELAMVSMTCR